MKVNYTTFASNEDMYAKLSSGAVSFDVVIPSDYMIARMRSEGMLLPLDYGNIPNYSNISGQLPRTVLDPDDSTPCRTPTAWWASYTTPPSSMRPTRTTGTSWNRNTPGASSSSTTPATPFATAQYKLGLDVNDTDRAKWDSALAELKRQSPLVKSYVMDEVYNMMESGEAAIAPTTRATTSPCSTRRRTGVDLRFYYPQRTNYFIDAMCIPSCCQNKELAEIFINYMLSPEPAIANAEYICYASPNSAVYTDEGYIDDMGEDAMEILYPEIGDFSARYNEFAFRSLDAETLDYVNSLWETLKIS